MRDQRTLIPTHVRARSSRSSSSSDRPTIRATSKQEDSSEMDTRQNEMKLCLCLCQVGLSWSVGASLIHRFHWHKHMHAIYFMERQRDTCLIALIVAPSSSARSSTIVMNCRCRSDKMNTTSSVHSKQAYLAYRLWELMNNKPDARWFVCVCARNAIIYYHNLENIFFSFRSIDTYLTNSQEMKKKKRSGIERN